MGASVRRSAPVDDLERLAGDLPLLVRRDDEHGDLGAVGRDRPRARPPRRRCAPASTLDAEALQAAAAPRARTAAAFSPTPPVKTTASTVAEHGVVGADVLADPVAVDVEGEPARRRRRPPGGSASSRKSLSPASPCSPLSRLSSRVDLARPPSRARGAGAARAPGRRRRSGCPSPAPRAGSAPSRCRPTRPPPTAAARRAVAEVQHDQVARPRAAGRAARRPRRDDERVRGAVEAVAADPVLLAPGARDGVGVGVPAAASGGTRCRRRRRAARRGTAAGRPAMPSRLAGLCSGASGTRSLDRGEHVVVDERRARRSGRRRARRGARPRRGRTSSSDGPCCSKASSAARRRVLVVGASSCSVASSPSRPAGGASRPAPRRSARRGPTPAAVAGRRRRAAGTSATTSRR